MSWGAFWYPHTVHVRDALPAGGMGGGFGAARTLAAEVIDKQTLVRDSNGAEVVSSSQVSLPLPESVPVGSLVTVWPGLPQQRQARVLASSLNLNSPPLDDFLLLSLE